MISLKQIYDRVCLHLALNHIFVPDSLQKKFHEMGWKRGQVPVVLCNPAALSHIEGYQEQWVDSRGAVILADPALRDTHDRVVYKHYGRLAPAQN